jgi:hypothetical protein
MDVGDRRIALPTFQAIPQKEAELETATGVRAQRMKEYLGYLDQAAKGQAGRLTPDQGETATAVTRRLRAAAETAGVELVVKREGDVVYFWRQSRKPGRPRRRGGSASSG